MAIDRVRRKQLLVATVLKQLAMDEEFSVGLRKKNLGVATIAAQILGSSARVNIVEWYLENILVIIYVKGFGSRENN